MVAVVATALDRQTVELTAVATVVPSKTAVVQISFRVAVARVVVILVAVAVAVVTHNITVARVAVAARAIRRVAQQRLRLVLV